MINKAIKIAKTLPKDKYRIVAIITDKRGRILSKGFNSYKKTHPKQLFYARKIGNKDKIFKHAEIDALIKCKHKPYAIYLARLGKNNKPLLSKPCKLCQLALKDAGIKKIYHT
jgi:deoxycytidylate deaminase